MPVDPTLVAAEMDRAIGVLKSLVGESVDAIRINSLEAADAPFLGKIVSKLSPMVGNLLEARIIQVLDEEAEHGFSWRRQDPGFPDAVLVDDRGNLTGSGFEVKAWFVHSTELTGRFRESVNLLEPRDVRLLVVAWAMSHLVYGTPKILGVLATRGTETAKARDRHYWNPPDYLTIEPNDTTARTANLQQSNVNGFKLQEIDGERLRVAHEMTSEHGADRLAPHSPEAQAVAQKLMATFPYRLDTNFAKIDRIESDDIENFKSSVLALTHEGRRVSQWTSLLRDLSLEQGSPREVAAAQAISAIYDQL